MITETQPIHSTSEACPQKVANYANVTERPGQKASAIQLRMLAARYNWAASQAEAADVLEVACGSGMGLSVLARTARWVAGCDVDHTNLADARRAYGQDPRVALQWADAVHLPYPDARFDLVLLFEAIYYLPDVARFLKEAHRVLRPGGRLLIVSVNREWRGFNPSPCSVYYLSADELQRELSQSGFAGVVQAAFPERASRLNVCVGWVRRTAVFLHLIPRTMGHKALLKRMFYGRLQPVPACLPASSVQPEELTSVLATHDRTAYRVLYATGEKL